MRKNTDPGSGQAAPASRTQHTVRAQAGPRDESDIAHRVRTLRAQARAVYAEMAAAAQANHRGKK